MRAVISNWQPAIVTDNCFEDNRLEFKNNLLLEFEKNYKVCKRQQDQDISYFMTGYFPCGAVFYKVYDEILLVIPSCSS